MDIPTTKWTAIIGVLLLIASIILLLPAGWIIWEYLLLLFPAEVWRGQAGLGEWFIAIYGLELPLLIITGVSLLKYNRATFSLVIVTILYTYLALGIWLAVGSWPFYYLIDRGSTEVPLMLGNRILAQGDDMPYQIDIHGWLIKMCLLTVVFAAVTLACVRNFRRGNASTVA